jgi:hypothetical protein
MAGGGVGDGVCTARDFWTGTYDEEAEARAFTAAVLAWRHGGRSDGAQ